jgi:DUF1680 family protein
MIEKAQGEDGYLNIYFTVVDPEGRVRNLRDMHEMCELRGGGARCISLPQSPLRLSLCTR